jgi:hypothetical protein
MGREGCDELKERGGDEGEGERREERKVERGGRGVAREEGAGKGEEYNKGKRRRGR